MREKGYLCGAQSRPGGGDAGRRMMPARGGGRGPRKASNGANLGFEEKLWQAADKLRGHMDASEYKNVVLGLIFLKYISDAFDERRSELRKDREADLEDRDEYASE